MSTRQVANLLATAAPEVLPPRDTLRAAAPDRYTLKVSIDQECEQSLRLLKDLMSHVDPRMSWGDLVARLVRDAVARHDPRGGGSRQRRRRSASSAGNPGASPRRAPKETRAAGPAGGPAQRVGESSERAPNRTRAAVAPLAPARRTGGATPAPPGDTAATEGQHPIGVLASAVPPSQSAPAAPLDGARAGDAPSGAPAATAAPQSAPAARLDGARAGAVPSGAPAATCGAESPAPADWLDGARYFGGSRQSASPDGGPSSASAGGVAGAVAGASAAASLRAIVCQARATSAPEPQSAGPLTEDRAARELAGAVTGAGGFFAGQACRARRSLLRRRSRHSACPLTADRAARRPGQGAAPRRLASLRAQACRARRSPLRRRSPPSACSPTVDRPKRQPGQRHTRPAILPTTAANLRLGSTFPRLYGATSGYATVDAAVIAIRSPGGAAPRPICCRSTTCCPSQRAVARSRPTSISNVEPGVMRSDGGEWLI